MKPYLRVIAIGIALVLLAPDNAHAQGVRIRVVDSATAIPLRGALIALVGADSTVIAEALSLESGSRYFPVPAGRYRVRVRRIGYRPHVSAPVTVPGQAELVIAVPAHPVTLTSIVISARSRCRSVASGTELASVWDEVSKALQASRLTMEDLRSVGRAWKYSKLVAGDGAVLQADTVRFTVTNPRAFRALDPQALATTGYVHGDEKAGWDFYGPDETVLLSPSFAATHCFKLIDSPEDDRLIGLSFEPVRDRRTSDIAGVAWIDRRTNELRRMTFRFVNAGLVSSFGGGGETRFARLPSGAWIVSEWYVRGPRLRSINSVVSPDGFAEGGGGVVPPG